MRPLHPWALAVVLLIGPGASNASAVSTRDLVMLHQAGLGDDVLIELMESDGSEYFLNAEQIVELRRQGLSERVIIAMLRTRRAVAPVQPARDPAVLTPGIFEPVAPVVPPSPVVAVAPVVVNVTQQVEQRTDAERVRTVYVPVAVPIQEPRRSVRQSSRREVSGNADRAGRTSTRSSVYWGWGGERRPDSWGRPPSTKNTTKKKN